MEFINFMDWEELEGVIFFIVNLFISFALIYLGISIYLQRKGNRALPGIAYPLPKHSKLLRKPTPEELKILEWESSFFHPNNPLAGVNITHQLLKVVAFLIVVNFSLVLFIRNFEIQLTLLGVGLGLLFFLSIKSRIIYDYNAFICQLTGTIKLKYQNKQVSSIKINGTKFPLNKHQKEDFVSNVHMIVDGQNVIVEFSPFSRRIWRINTGNSNPHS